MNKELKCGLKDGIPIALGYFAVSFSLGIAMLAGGLSWIESGLLSLTNVTSAGEYAGLKVIVAGGTIIEIVLTQFIINIRYALMSLSLSQKLSKMVRWWQRLLIAFANTDEIFAVAMSHQKSLTYPYMFGLQSLPILGWTLGTILGNVAADLLPKRLTIAMGVALFGMFIAIVIPEMKKKIGVTIVVLVAVLISCLLYYVPFLSFISEGIGIVLATIIASIIGAIFFPVENTESEEEDL